MSLEATLAKRSALAFCGLGIGEILNAIFEVKFSIQFSSMYLVTKCPAHLVVNKNWGKNISRWKNFVEKSTWGEYSTLFTCLCVVTKWTSHVIVVKFANLYEIFWGSLIFSLTGFGALYRFS